MAILIVEISASFALMPSVALTFSIVGVSILNILITLRVDASFPAFLPPKCSLWQR